MEGDIFGVDFRILVRIEFLLVLLNGPSVHQIHVHVLHSFSDKGYQSHRRITHGR